MGDVPGTKVWVGNLGSTCEERDLRDEFSKFGELNKVGILCVEGLQTGCARRQAPARGTPETAASDALVLVSCHAICSPIPSVEQLHSPCRRKLYVLFCVCILSFLVWSVRELVGRMARRAPPGAIFVRAKIGVPRKAKCVSESHYMTQALLGDHRV